MACKKLKQNQRGFTLVEVIVVAVIVAAMAAVAVPMYLGYVDSSRKNAAANAAGSIASFCGACVNSGGSVGVIADGRLTCENEATGNTSITIPADINITLVGNPEADPPVARGVEAVHTAHLGTDSEEENTVTYNY